jgi:hypothetical protein
MLLGPATAVSSPYFSTKGGRSEVLVRIWCQCCHRHRIPGDLGLVRSCRFLITPVQVTGHLVSGGVFRCLSYAEDR